MLWSRRHFLRVFSMASASGFTGAAGAVDPVLAAIARGPRMDALGYGPLVKDPAGLLDLPAGFQYRMFSSGIMDSERDESARFASMLDNGEPTPGRHDGMGAFAGPGGVTILVRNHEMDLGWGPPVDLHRVRPYDPSTAGGTTTLWVDSERRLVKSFPSLSGTLRNCAGGTTPWGSWLTAEETTYVPGEKSPLDADRTPDVSKRHGYIFEVDAHATDLVEPVPIVAMGRFRHEAVAVDPATGFAYLTEDRDDGLFYRYRPHVLARGTAPSRLGVGDYARGGVLEALRVKSRPQLLTNNWNVRAISLRESLQVDWVPIPDVDPSMDMAHPPGDTGKEITAPSSTRAQGFALGCAQFARTEGITYAKGAAYFCCTSGGPRKLGQVFKLDLRKQLLSLVVEPEDDALLDGPDNICVAPHGDLVICEDSLAQRQNFVVGVTRTGKCYRIARNAHRSNREFAGACFSADGRTLFVNVQQPGLTFAIWGPWSARRD